MVVVLIGEDESHIVVVDLGVNEEGSLKVDPTEAMEAHDQAGVGVHRLDNLGTLVVDHPVGINLRVAMGIQNHGLVCPGEKDFIGE